MQQSNRIIGLDIVRVLLALLIFLFHSRIHVHCNYVFLNALINNGHIIGMTAFFMLSGYCLLISSSHRNFKDFCEIKQFYLKRLIAVYPLYLITGCLGAIVLILTHSHSILDEAILIPVELFGIQSFFNTLFSFSHNGGTWFISCLLFCYFMFPFILMLLKQLKNKAIIVLLVLLVFILSYSPFVTIHFGISDNYSNPFFRLLEFIIGMLLAMINTSPTFNSKFLDGCRGWTALISSSFLLALGISLATKFDWYLFWIPVCCIPFILLSAGNIQFPVFLDNRITVFLSNISYSFYLGQLLVWHPLKLLIKDYWHSPSNFVLIAVSLTLCVICSLSLHYLIEKPVGKWLKTIIAVK